MFLNLCMYFSALETTPSIAVVFQNFQESIGNIFCIFKRHLLMAGYAYLASIEVIGDRQTHFTEALFIVAVLIDRFVVYLHTDTSLLELGEDILFWTVEFRVEDDRVEMARTFLIWCYLLGDK